MDCNVQVPTEVMYEVSQFVLSLNTEEVFILDSFPFPNRFTEYLELNQIYLISSLGKSHLPCSCSSIATLPPPLSVQGLSAAIMSIILQKQMFPVHILVITPDVGYEIDCSLQFHSCMCSQFQSDVVGFPDDIMLRVFLNKVCTLSLSTSGKSSLYI